METLTLCELDLLYQKSSALYSLVCVEAQIADWVKGGGGGIEVTLNRKCSVKATQTNSKRESRLKICRPDSVSRPTKCADYPGPTLTYTTLVLYMNKTLEHYPDCCNDEHGSHDALEGLVDHGGHLDVVAAV